MKIYDQSGISLENQDATIENHFLTHPVIHVGTVCGYKLTDSDQAEKLIRKIVSYSKNHIELDFTGIHKVSVLFCHEFMHRLDSEIQNVWLIPRHYNHNNKLIRPLVSRLRHLREKAWRDSFDQF